MNKFEINDRVQVTSKYCNKTYGMQGTVIFCDYNYTKVRIDGKQYTNNYRKSSLKLINDYKGDNIMTGNFKVAGVKFLSGYNIEKTYDFALFDENVVVGDTVVCDTVNGFTIGNVVSINDKNEVNSNKVSKEVVCKIDMSAFKERKENRIKANQLKNAMAKRVKELQDITLFEVMAEKDDSLKDMLHEYKSLIAQ